MKRFLASVAAVALMGGTASAQVILVPQGEGAGGQQQFILVPIPQDQLAPQQGANQQGNAQGGRQPGNQQGQQGGTEQQQATGQQLMRERAEAMALDLYRRGYQRGIADAQSAAGPALDPSAMEQIGRELFERGYMLGLMQARAQMTAQQTPQPGGEAQSVAHGQGAGTGDAGQVDVGQENAGQGDASQGDAGQTNAGQTNAGQTNAGQAGAGQADAAQQLVTPEQIAQAAQGQTTGQGETAAADGEQVAIGSAESQEHGTYLTDGSGRPVYMLEADQQGTGDDAQARSTCSGACAEAWPPVTSPVKPLAEGPANEEMLATIDREGGGSQVTYNGWPLYYYAEDESASQPTGHDVHDEWGEWYLLQPNGEKVAE